MAVVYTNPHILFTVGGDGYLSTEFWQFSVRCDYSSLPLSSDLQALANAMATPTSVLYSTAAMNFSEKTRLLWLKAALIGTTGHYPPDSVPGIYTYPSPVVPGATQQVVPQATMAVTLLTNLPRGRASRGRFYLPPQGTAIQTDGRISAASADAMEATIKTWLNALVATAQVESIIVMSGLGTGTKGTVNAIGMGRVIDTMRSRRRSLLEARTPLAL